MPQLLLPAEIPGLRDRVKRGLTTAAQEADRYGVGVETIRRAVRGDTFRSVREGLITSQASPNYGRRATDLVSEADARASLDRMRKAAGETIPLNADNLVDEFLKQRKESSDDH